jgi:rod shape-determining protein MreC
MERLFYFLYQYRAFFIFLLLELFCAWLIIRNNQYQGAQFFNSSNRFVAGMNSFTNDVREYFSLRETNRFQAEEIARLRNLIEQQSQRLDLHTGTQITDSALLHRYEFISAKVVNNSVHRFTNFITIDKGEDANLQPGMAVISPQGVVGKVKNVSKHYSVVTSLLNIDVMVSALIKRTGHYGSIQWDGHDPDIVKLNFIPRHVIPQKGDTIVTSGYNAIFPQGVSIGTIEKIELRDEALFYDLKVKVSQDFRKLSYVSIVKSNLKQEQDSLEQTIDVPNR